MRIPSSPAPSHTIVVIAELQPAYRLLKAISKFAIKDVLKKLARCVLHLDDSVDVTLCMVLVGLLVAYPLQDLAINPILCWLLVNLGH